MGRSIHIGGVSHIFLLYYNFISYCVSCSATSNETGFTGNVSSDLKGLFPQLESTDIQGFLEAYPVSEFANATQRGDTIVGELLLRCGVSLFLQHLPNIRDFRVNQKFRVACLRELRPKRTVLLSLIATINRIRRLVMTLSWRIQQRIG
jgi:hypothetical protein